MEEIKRCNKCAGVLDDFDLYENLSIKKLLGYGSKYDGSRLNIQLCCACMDTLIDECLITPISD